MLFSSKKLRGALPHRICSDSHAALKCGLRKSILAIGNRSQFFSDNLPQSIFNVQLLLHKQFSQPAFECMEKCRLHSIGLNLRFHNGEQASLLDTPLAHTPALFAMAADTSILPLPHSFDVSIDNFGQGRKIIASNIFLRQNFCVATFTYCIDLAENI